MCVCVCVSALRITPKWITADTSNLVFYICIINYLKLFYEDLRNNLCSGVHNSEILHLRRGRDYCWDTWGTCTYDRIFGASKICFVNTLKIHIQQKIKKYICSFRIYYTLCNGKSSLRIKFFQSTKLNIICYFTNAYYLLLKLYKISQFSMQNYDLKLTLWTKLIHLCAFKHEFMN